MDPHFEGVIFQTHAAELARRLQRPFPPYRLLDVRDPADFAAGHIPAAGNTSPEALRQGLPEGTGPGTEFFVIGAAPGDAAVRQASEALRASGAHRIVEFSGGMSEWSALGFEVVGEQDHGEHDREEAA